jgi:hypothetical protein
MVRLLDNDLNRGDCVTMWYDVLYSNMVRHAQTIHNITVGEFYSRRVGHHFPLTWALYILSAMLSRLYWPACDWQLIVSLFDAGIVDWMSITLRFAVMMRMITIVWDSKELRIGRRSLFEGKHQMAGSPLPRFKRDVPHLYRALQVRSFVLEDSLCEIRLPFREWFWKHHRGNETPDLQNKNVCRCPHSGLTSSFTISRGAV